MAKGKWDQVKKNLPLIEKWARDGLSEAQIQKNLGIGKSTFERYKTEHKDLRDSLKKGREPLIAEVQNALTKRALGFEYEEMRTYIRIEEGKEVRYQEKSKKYYPPDVAACFILLKNKDRGNWSDNPAKLDLDKQMAEFRKELEKNKNF